MGSGSIATAPQKSPVAPLIAYRDEILAALDGVDLVPLMEQAFVALAEGHARVGAVGELRFADPPGDVHVKSGAIDGAPSYVVKVASGFYRNPARGLPSSLGLMLLFAADSGVPQAVLLDEGMLTDHRTAAAGAVAAKHLAPADPGAIAILGAGIQAELQLAYLRGVTRCREAVIWARRPAAAEALAGRAAALGFTARVAATAAEAAAPSRLVVTCTPAESPLLQAEDIAPGTHITAVGADSEHKGELPDALLAQAALLVADSAAQARERGELRRAAAGATIHALGDVVAGRVARPDGISIADLTGVAVQDLAIARAVHAALIREPSRR